MSKTGNSPLPRPLIHPQPNTNDGRQILDQQENVSHRCFPRRASRKTPQRGLNPLPNSRASPPCQSPNIPALFCSSHRRVLPKKQFADPSSIPVSEPRPRCGRTMSQIRTCLAPDADVSRPRCGRITSQTRACLDPDALTSLIFRASLIINLLILSKWKISVVTTGKLVGNLRDKRNHHTTPR